MKFLETILRVLKILVGMHEYATNQKQGKNDCNCKCCSDKEKEDDGSNS